MRRSVQAEGRGEVRMQDGGAGPEQGQQGNGAGERRERRAERGK